jgi:hypothetical protein
VEWRAQIKRERKIFTKYRHGSEHEHNGLTTASSSQLWFGIHTVGKTCNSYHTATVKDTRVFRDGCTVLGISAQGHYCSNVQNKKNGGFFFRIIHPDEAIFYSESQNKIVLNRNDNRDSAVGIATGYGLDDRGVGVRVLVGSSIFTSPSRPERLWGSPSLLFSGCRGLFPRG